MDVLDASDVENRGQLSQSENAVTSEIERISHLEF
jgi:hypothetical protein